MSNDEDSDSGSLPDLSQILTTTTSRAISAGDIVWAKFKNLYWPALVRCIYAKEKKITVWYTDEPGKTFKLPLKNVCSFNDSKMRQKIENDVKKAGCVQEHEGLTYHAIDYLNRKAQGIVDDPLKFFDQTYPYYLMEELLKKNPNADVSNIKIPHLYITPEKKMIRKNLNLQNITDESAESEVESVSDDEEGIKNVPKDYLQTVKKRYSSVISKDLKADEIVELIKTGKADVYLKKIHSKRIPSDYRDLCEKALKCNKKCADPVTYTGPIENDDQLRELIFYLLDFCDNLLSSPQSKRICTRSRKTKIADYPLLKKKSDSAQYVASVLLPEAIIYAMSEIYKISTAKAKKLFQEKSESETKKVENIIASLGSGDTSNKTESGEDNGQD